MAAIRESFEEAGVLLAYDRDGTIVDLRDPDEEARFSIHRKAVDTGERRLIEVCADEELRLVTYAQAGAYLLVETPYGRLPDMFEEMLFQIASRGYRIVLAHPERNPSFQAKPDRLRALVERDVAIQVTAHSLEPTRRKSKTGRLARALLTDDLAHVVASDFHRPVGTRRPQLSQAMAAVDRVSPGIGRWMVDDVPTAILAGAALPRRPVSSSSRPRWRVLRSKR